MEAKLKKAQAFEKFSRGVVATISTPKGLVEIYETEHSGKVITRAKIDTLTGVLHPGIVIGNDKDGRSWIAHNHFNNKRPTIDLYVDYLDGQEGMWDEREVKFTRKQILDRTLDEVLLAKKYEWVDYNCQVFVNIVTRNEKTSESVDKISNGLMIAGSALTLFGLFTRNKTLRNIGLTALSVGGVGKIYNALK